MRKQTQITIIPVDLCRFKVKIKPYLFIVYTSLQAYNDIDCLY